MNTSHSLLFSSCSGLGEQSCPKPESLSDFVCTSTHPSPLSPGESTQCRVPFPPVPDANIFHIIVGALGSNHRPSSTKPSRESTPVPSGFPNEGRGLPSSARTSTSSDGSGQQQQHGHYRGITFEEILPPHLIMNAPPPGVEQKKGSSKSTERPPTSEPPPPVKRSYPPAVKRSGGKSRFRDTARALVRRFSISVARKDTGKRRGYEVV